MKYPRDLPSILAEILRLGMTPEGYGSRRLMRLVLCAIDLGGIYAADTELSLIDKFWNGEREYPLLPDAHGNRWWTQPKDRQRLYRNPNCKDRDKSLRQFQSTEREW
jgi:hypothetical protein